MEDKAIPPPGLQRRGRTPRPDRGWPVDCPLKMQRKNSGWHAIAELGSFCQKSLF
jgi:hypothetical protein